MTTDELLRRMDGVKAVSGGFQCICPSHADSTASLSVSAGNDGRVLLHCHAGCEPGAIVAALGLTLADLFAPNDEARASHSPVAVYEYRDEQNVLLFQALRYPKKPNGDKDFKQRRPDGNGGWIWKLEQTRRVPYRLPELKGKPTVVIVEGEKDADRLWSLHVPATCNAGGAGKWKDALTETLKACGVKRVVVLADNDPPGEAHAIQVARSCDDAGLLTKRILLPGLPPKGDVSDWLDAGHAKAELLDIIKNAPPFNSHQRVATRPKLETTSLADLLTEPESDIDWLVDDRIPGGGLVLLAGKPKAGKSTCARSLAYCVASGTPWLGHHVTAGPVLYLALEDKRSEVRRHLARMGATGQEPLSFLFGEAPAGMLAMLERWVVDHRPVLIVIDTLQRLIRAEDMNDYAEVTTKFAPLLKLTRETGAAVVCLHHAKKFGEGLDAVLGSTALSGSVDNIFVLSRGERDRTLQSVQRIGPDMEPTVVEQDEDTGGMVAKGSKRMADLNHAADLILEALRDEREPQTERWLREHIEASPRCQGAALRMLVRLNSVWRTGAGRKGDTYLYGVDRKPEKPEKPEKPRDAPKPRCHTKPETHKSAETVQVLSTLEHNVQKSVDTAEVDDSLFANPDDDHDGGVH